jgi:hypothetical protein
LRFSERITASLHSNFKITEMTEETDKPQPEDKKTPEEQAAPKPVAKKPILTKPSGNPFLGKAGNFNKGKSGGNITGFKGKVFKGSGVKKGK